MADILVLITIILVIFYAKEIKKTISSKFIMIFFQVREPAAIIMSTYLTIGSYLPDIILKAFFVDGSGFNLRAIGVDGSNT